MSKKILEMDLLQEEDDADFKANFVENLSAVLRCAGLLHDLGNPPFGHSGEEYIRDYFQDHEADLRNGMPDEMWYDFINFEGNAQNIRIITKLGGSSNPDRNKFHYGMDLTEAVIGSLIKYPWTCLDYLNREPQKRGKIGYYFSESWITDGRTYNLFSDLGMKRDGNENDRKSALYNPIMRIMEAADDIAYSTADMEDALKKGYIKIEDFDAAYLHAYPNEEEQSNLRDDEIIRDRIRRIRSDLIEAVVNAFIDNYEDIMAGEKACDLCELVSGNLKDMVGNLKDLISTLYKQRDDRADIAYGVKFRINKCLEMLLDAQKKNADKEELSLEDKLLLDEMDQYTINAVDEWNNAIEHRPGFKEEDLTHYYEYMSVVDFVSGMTDSYAIHFLTKLQDENFRHLKEWEEKNDQLKITGWEKRPKK